MFSRCENSSNEPVYYATGEVRLRFRDIAFEGFGRKWAHVRGYGNLDDPQIEGPSGFGWSDLFIPKLAVQGDTAALRFGPGKVFYFDRINAVTFRGRFFFGNWLFLVENTTLGRWELNTRRGRILLFAEDSGSASKAFIGTIEPNGETVDAVYETTGDHRLLRIVHDDGGVLTGLAYSYLGSTSTLGSVTLLVEDQEVRRAVYAYYGESETGGLPGNLKTATSQKWNVETEEWETLGTSYYRYYTQSEAPGVENGLKFSVGEEAYARLQAAGIDPLTGTDEEVAAFADYYFEYDSLRRVTLESVRGGAYTYRFAYSTNPNSIPPDDSSSSTSSASSDDPWVPPATGAFNEWWTKTVVTMPDNTQEIAYCNRYGQVMLKLFRSHEGEWCRYWRYNDKGRKVLVAQPSAVADYDERNFYLVTLHASQGLVRLFEYYTSGTSGGAPGQPSTECVREGEQGESVPIADWEYVSRAVDGNTIYFVSKVTRYVGVPGGNETAETAFAYSFHGTTAVISERITTFPAIPTTQNGSGTANTVTEEFDLYGNRTSRVDERGIEQTWTYDVARSGVTQHVMDVGGLDLTTDFTLDDEGRTVRTLGPAHTIDVDGAAEEIRSATWTVYLDAAHETRTGSGYLIDSTATLINPVEITRMDRAGRVIEEIQARRANTAGPLSASDTFTQPDYCRWTKFEFDQHSSLDRNLVYHHIPAVGEGQPGFDYAETRYGYDSMGRRIQTVSPEGTITRNVLDTRGLVSTVWIGTDDAGATPDDPSGNDAAGNNMVQVEAREYDRGAIGGDGLLTETIAYTGDSDARVTSFEYDYRGRRIVTLGEHGFRETYTHDALGQVLVTERWNDEGVTPLRVAKDESLYDKLGRVYRTIRYAVDPVTGQIGASLPDDVWFDPVGNVMKRRNPEDAGFEKLVYDGAGRVSNRYAGYNSVTPSYSEAETVANDTIFDQTDFAYDDAGNVVQESRRDRFHNTTGLGALGGPGGAAPNARVNYVMYYPDALGRVMAVANYGTNGGTAPSRPDTIPAASDVILVSLTEFNDCGEISRMTDPKGTVTVQEFDDAGRLIKVIENYQP